MIRDSKDGCSQDDVNQKNSRGYPRTAAVFTAVALFVCIVGTAFAGTAAAQDVTVSPGHAAYR